MRSVLRKVGHSRGIIIPAAFLAACNLGDEVDIRVEGDHLLISSVNTPRADGLMATT